MGRSKAIDRLGYKGRTKQGEAFTVVVYNGSDDVVIEFDNGDRKHIAWNCITRGTVCHHNNEWKKIDRTGEENISRYGERCRIVRYKRYEEIEVEFDDGARIWTNYSSFRGGKVRNPNLKYTTHALAQRGLQNMSLQPHFNNREGERAFNSKGYEMTIIQYINANKILVEFVDTGYQTWSSWRNFKSGGIKDPLAKDIYGVACFGEGEYNSNHPAYRRWFDMIRRCYDTEWHKKAPTYEEASVCDEWLNYQNFAAWYKEHQPPEQDWHLDKDLISGKSKIYSPDTCVFLPSELNMLITKNEAIRGELPMGVIEDEKRPGIYISRLTNNIGLTDKTYLFYKSFNSIEEAFNAYRNEKLKWVGIQADKFKSKLEPKAYEALLHWDITITD